MGGCGGEMLVYHITKRKLKEAPAWLLEQKLVRMKAGERALHSGGRCNDDLRKSGDGLQKSWWKPDSQPVRYWCGNDDRRFALPFHLLPGKSDKGASKPFGNLPGHWGCL